MTTGSVDLVRARNQRLAELCADIRRDPATIRRSVATGFLIGRTRDELRERSRRLQSLVPPLARVQLDDVPGAAREMGWVVGRPVEIVAALQPLAQTGVDLAILGHYDLDDVAALESIAADVMPALA